MGLHLPRIPIILWLSVLLEYATAVTQSLSASTFHPNANGWTSNGGQYISTQSGDETYVDFVFNLQGEGYVTLSINAYGYTGSPTSPAPASYTIDLNGVKTVYGASQQQPVVFTGLDPTSHYRAFITAPDAETGVIVNSVVVSRPDPPASSPPAPPISSTLPSSSAVVASTAQSHSLSASSLSTNPSSLVGSAGTSTGTVNATSIAGQSLGVPIFVTISGSVIPQGSQTSTLISPSSSGSSGISIGIILGSIAGVIAIMIITAFIFIRRRKQAQGKREENEIDSYLIEAEAQQRSPSIDPSSKEQLPMTLEKSRALFHPADRGGEGTPSRETAMAPSATAHVSYITTITASSLSARAQRGAERSSSNPFTHNSRTSMGSAEDESVAPPAYVEEERNVTPRNDRS